MLIGENHRYFIVTNLKYIIMNNSGNTMLAVIIGSAIGATLGILYAPDKGENTRRLIADKASETKDNLTSSAIDLKDRVANTSSF